MRNFFKRIFQVKNHPDPAVKQALGHEQLRERICVALKEKFPMPNMEMGLWVVEVYDDGRCIFQDMNGEYYQINYAVENDAVTLSGDLAPVKREIQYVAQQAFGHFVQAVDTTEGWEWEVVLVEAGTSKTKDHFPKETLQAAISLFEGARAFAHSEGQHVENSLKKPVKDIVGWYDNVRMNGEKMVARLHLLKAADWLRVMLVDAWEKGKKNLLGLSIDAGGQMTQKEVGGEWVRYWTQLARIDGVDVVWDPAAGGAFIKVLAADRTETQTKEEDKMNKEQLLKLLQARRPDLYAKINLATVTIEELSKVLEEALPVQQAAAVQPTGGISEADSKRILQADARNRLSTALADSKLPEATQAKVKKQFEGVIFEDAALQQAITGEREYLGKLTESGKVHGFGDSHVEVEGEGERIQMAVHKMFGVQGEDVKKCDIAPFTSIRQAYVRITGDKDIRGFIDPAKQKLQQAITSTTFANLLGNTLYRKLLQDYMEQNYGERNIISVGSAPDFRTREQIRIGYFGDLATVDPETADYAEIAAPADEKVSYAVTQRGNILTITRKTIINDDLRGISKMVGRLGRAARRTFAQFVWDFFRNNATYDVDSLAWFHATHANLRTVALSAAEIEQHLILLQDMTEPNSGKKLGLNFSGGFSNLGLWLVVPTALFGTAKKENEREYLDANFTPNPVRYVFGQNSERITVNPLLTDANDWGIFRDARDVESIVVDFLGGQEEPELFLADQPTVGQMFVADKLQYKIRHEYGGDIVDFRGATKAVVA